MLTQIQTCRDNHHCFNGSKCVQNPYDKGSYYCDCDEVIWDVRYEGLHCEHKAEVYCTGPNSKGLDEWFCTNGGTCHVENGNEKDGQWACLCPDNFEGSFCQFVKGSKPKGYPFSQETNKVNLGGGGSFVSGLIGSLVTLLIIGVVAFKIIYRGRGEIVSFASRFAVGQTKDAVERSMRLASKEATVIDRVESNTVSQIIEQEAPTDQGVDIQQRPDTRQSEAGLSYASERKDFDDDNSLLSFT